MTKLNSMLLLDKNQKSALYGIYSEDRSLAYLANRFNLLIPFIIYTDNFNYRIGKYLVIIEPKKLINLVKIDEKFE